MIHSSPDQTQTKEIEIASGFEKFLLNVVEGSKFPKVKKVLYGAVSKAVHFVKKIVIGKVEIPNVRGNIEQMYIDVRLKSDTLTHISVTLFRKQDGEINKETYDLRNKVLRDGPFVTSRVCQVEEIQQLQTELEEFLAKDSKEVNLYFDLISAYNLFDEKLKLKPVYTFFVDGEKLSALNILKMSDGRIQLQHVNTHANLSTISSVFLIKHDKNKVSIEKSEKIKKDFKFPNSGLMSVGTFRVHRLITEPVYKVPANEIDEMMNSAILNLVMN